MDRKMTKHIHFELVSPERKLVSEPVHMAVIPGMEGELGVCADHAAFVVALKSGVVRLYSDEKQIKDRIFIAGGFADVTGALCAVLAEQAVNLNDLDQDTLTQELVQLEKDLSLMDGDADVAKLEQKIALTRAKLAALAA
jgi:F-type H+-transporting ATPase subunit epsilon